MARMRHAAASLLEEEAEAESELRAKAKRHRRKWEEEQGQHRWRLEERGGWAGCDREDVLWVGVLSECMYITCVGVYSTVKLAPPRWCRWWTASGPPDAPQPACCRSSMQSTCAAPLRAARMQAFRYAFAFVNASVSRTRIAGHLPEAHAKTPIKRATSASRHRLAASADAASPVNCPAASTSS
eukprot:scaffold14628_cov118-Isochrysis_galbana.AAC.5